MAYKTQDLIDKAFKVLDKNKQIVTIDELALYLPCSLRTFYEHKLHESQDIKDIIDSNKVSIKSQLRDKWFKSDNATLQMGLYKLLATDEEYQRLSNIKYEITNVTKEVNLEELKTEIRELVKENGFS